MSIKMHRLTSFILYQYKETGDMSNNPVKLKNDEILPTHEFDYESFRQFILSNEEWLMKQILSYAKKQGYSRYTSTLMEAWRLSISGISNALISSYSSELELTPDEDYSIDPAASFGMLEARSHRERGVNLSMFLGLMKYYRQSYMDLIEQESQSDVCGDTCKLKIDRFFDRMELGFCTEWCSQTENDKVNELQGKNREITNEKNRYLTIFETIHAPVVLIDDENRVEDYNQAWNELFEESSIPGSIYYNKGMTPSKDIPGFIAEILPTLNKEIPDYTHEKTLVTKKGARHFQIRIKRMLDISDKYRGMVIILNDITDHKKAEKDKMHKEKLEGVLEMAGAICHEVNQPLQVVMGQAEILKMTAGKDNPIIKNLDTITSQIEKMGEITRRLMNITKYETKAYLKTTIIDIEKASPEKNSNTK
jgi:PAS domain S-box-containing protein